MAVNPFTEFEKTGAAGLMRKWDTKIGKIFDLVNTPCQNADMLFFVGAFFYSLPKALISLHSHDCTDYAYDKAKKLWQPYPRRGGRRHGRGGTPRFRGGKDLPQHAGRGTGFTYYGFRLGDLIQSLGMKMLIIDTALDLGINWMSTGLKWNGCGEQPPVHGIGLLPAVVIGNNGNIKVMDLIAEPGNVGVSMGIGGFATTIPTRTIQCMGTVDTEPFLGTKYVPPAFCKWVIKDVHGNEVPAVHSHGKNQEGPNGSQMWAKATYTGFAKQGFQGYLEVHEETGGDGGGIVVPTPCSVTGDFDGAGMWGDDKPDPCGNFLVTGR